MTQLIDPFTSANNPMYTVGTQVTVCTFDVSAGFLPTGWCDSMLDTMGCNGDVISVNYNSYTKQHFYEVEVTLHNSTTVTWAYLTDQVQELCN